MHAGTDDVERIDLDPGSPWWAEHRARYHWAAPHVGHADVLDVACGSGLGAPVLVAAGARQVLGVEVSMEALRVASTVRSDRFLPAQADGTQIPTRDRAFAVITSFETVEHIHEDHRFVAELARVLRDDGVLLLSTPNALHTKPVNGIPANPFHVREYTPQALESLLTTAFGDVRLRAQRPVAEHRPCPYWEAPAAQGSDLRTRLVAASWKALGRLPVRLRDAAWQRLHGRTYFPGEHDFEFSADALETGHVLVAECRVPLTPL
jgi:SAM-dependent methyltransferase